MLTIDTIHRVGHSPHAQIGAFTSYHAPSTTPCTNQGIVNLILPCTEQGTLYLPFTVHCHYAQSRALYLPFTIHCPHAQISTTIMLREEDFQLDIHHPLPPCTDHLYHPWPLLQCRAHSTCHVPSIIRAGDSLLTLHCLLSPFTEQDTLDTMHDHMPPCTEQDTLYLPHLLPDMHHLLPPCRRAGHSCTCYAQSFDTMLSAEHSLPTMQVPMPPCAELGTLYLPYTIYCHHAQSSPLSTCQA